MTEHRFLAGPVPREVNDALARLARAPDVARIAVMPDVHLAEEVCVGTVSATRRLLYPAAVGGDIGCGVAVLPLGVPAQLDAALAGRILGALTRAIPRDRHRRGSFAAWPDHLDPDGLSAPALARQAHREGQAQLGTLGSGNHFVELQRDDEGALWLMLHSGSRGLGPAIRDHHLDGGTRAAGGLVYLDADTDEGQRYLADAAWAIAWADANRAAMQRIIAEILVELVGASPGEGFSCHHNHVRREVHEEPLWVHRKGAMPAAVGERGAIPGSMGSASFHVEGRGLAEALASSSHGAGRAMSRTEARRRISPRELDRQLAGVWFDRRRLDDLCDEAPGAYKDIGRVMRAQRDLVRIVRRLEPVLCFKDA